MKNLLRALRYFRLDGWRLVLVFLLMVASVGLNVLKPWPLAIIVDSVLGDKPGPAWLMQAPSEERADSLAQQDYKLMALGLLAAGIFVLHLGQGSLAAVQNFLSIKIGLRGLTRVRNEIFGRLQSLSLKFHQGTTPGDLIYRASWDTYAFQTLFQQGLITFATAVLSLVLMVSVMAQLNGRLTLLALALVPLLIGVIKSFGRKMSERAVAAQQADSKVTSLVQQSIAAMPLIQSYTREEQEKSAFGERVVEAEGKRISQHGSELLYWFAITTVFGIGTAALTWLGANQVLQGKLTVGELLVFISYLALLYDPLNQLSHVGATVSGASAGVRRVFEILDANEEIKEAPDAKGLVRASNSGGESNPGRAGRVEPLVVRGALSFESVSFSYGEEREVLSEISFSLDAGESVALIGPSGAGKTTLLNLVPRLFDPSSGIIKLDGVDLRQLRLKDLRGQVALVLQQPIILPGTIAENIAYGKSGATTEEIIEAARSANADGFIQKLPKQYETVVGDGAGRLSIGEQQRLNLARAFLKDAPILLLDEPTSALDSESESLVLQSLKELMRGRTTLLVAHRLKTIRQVDKIIVLQSGRVTEMGSQEELARKGGYFARLVGS